MRRAYAYKSCGHAQYDLDFAVFAIFEVVLASFMHLIRCTQSHLSMRSSHSPKRRTLARYSYIINQITSPKKKRKRFIGLCTSLFSNSFSLTASIVSAYFRHWTVTKLRSLETLEEKVTSMGELCEPSKCLMLYFLSTARPTEKSTD